MHHIFIFIIVFESVNHRDITNQTNPTSKENIQYTSLLKI